MSTETIAHAYIIQPHFVLRSGDYFLADGVTGRAVRDPWRALNTCDRALAERLRDEQNERSGTRAWQVELLEGTASPQTARPPLLTKIIASPRREVDTLRRYPVYLTQEGVEQLCHVLYAYQSVVNVTSSDRPTSDLPTRLLSEVRRQCCDRSGAEDPMPYHPHVPGLFEGKKRRHG